MVAKNSQLAILQDRLTVRIRELGTNATAVSKEATGRPDAVRKILGTDNAPGQMPGADRLSAIAVALKCDVGWLMGSDTIPKNQAPVQDNQIRSPTDPRMFQTTGRRDLPVLGGATQSREGFVTLRDDPIDYVERPRMLEGVPGAYAIYMPGTTMEPRYFVGEILLCHPGRPITPGCFVVVRLTVRDGAGVRARVLRFMEADGRKRRFEQLNPVLETEREFVVHENEIDGIDRIVASVEG